MLSPWLLSFCFHPETSIQNTSLTMSLENLSLGSHCLSDQGWAWEWVWYQWSWPADDLPSLCSLCAKHLFASYHLTSLTCQEYWLSFVAQDTISYLHLHLLYSLLPRKPSLSCPSTFFCPKGCLETSYFTFRTSSDVSFCRTLSLWLLGTTRFMLPFAWYFCIFSHFIISDLFIWFTCPPSVQKPVESRAHCFICLDFPVTRQFGTSRHICQINKF